MIVDVSHISDEGFWDIIKVTEKPIIASHSNSRKICDVSRNLTDEMFRAICETGGVASFNQCAPFVGEKPDLDTVCDHILHFLELDPDCRHIALGGDLDGCDELPAGFDGVQSYPAMANALLDRGVGEKIVHNIYWNNAMEVFRHAVPIHRK
jgi:membrane dipeptidase